MASPFNNEPGVGSINQDAMVLRDTEIWVNHFTEESAHKFRIQVLAAAAPDPNIVIPIYIDSYGGYVDALAKMLATMDEVPNRFITICMGKAASCGAILLSNGDLRFCDKYSRVMIHNISNEIWGDLDSLKADVNETTRMNELFMGLLAQNCGMSYSQLQAKIRDTVGGKDMWMSPQMAKSFGLIDEIGTPILQMAPSFNVNVAPAKTKREPPRHSTPKKKPTKRK